MITVRALSKRYKSKHVVRDLSFTCERGRITGLLGPEGSGKSVTLRMITGLVRPDAGVATIDGQSFAALPNPSRVVGAVLDAAAVHPGCTGRSAIRVAAEMAGVGRDGVTRALRQAGLTGADANRQVGEYSRSMLVRLALARALVGRPHVLLLDDPTNGLDVPSLAWLRGLLRDFTDHGGTVLLTGRPLIEVRAVVDRVVGLDGGRVAAGVGGTGVGGTG